MDKKFLTIVLVVVGILAIGGGVYYFLFLNKQAPAAPAAEQQIPDLDRQIPATTGQISPESQPIPKEIVWLTYMNERYGFSFKYPNSWSVVAKEGDASSGSLISIKFGIKSGTDEFLGLVGCFKDLKTVDPFYMGEFRASEPITIGGVSTSVYRDQSRGDKTLKFYLPLIKQGDARCGIFFQGFSELSGVKKDIVISLSFMNGFDAFADFTLKQFQAKSD